MTQAPEMARPAAAPAAGGPSAGGPDLNALAKFYLDGHLTGVEGREEEFARGVMQVIATIKDTKPYPHEMNDALVKTWLLSIQFVKDQGLLPEFVVKDIEVMRPVNKRMAGLISATGEKEVALEAVAGYSPCHHHLVLQTWKEPGARSWISPFTTVLDAGKAIGQFDLTEQEIHEEWFIPRIHGFAEDLGVPLKVSPWDEATRKVTVSLA